MAKTPHSKPEGRIKQEKARQAKRTVKTNAKAVRPRLHKDGQMSGAHVKRRSSQKLEGYFMTSRKGYGFVRNRNAGWPDIFIAPGNVAGARQYDHVLVKLLTPAEGKKIDKESRLEGVILKVLHHVDEADLLQNDGQDMQMVMWQLGAPGDFPAQVLAEAAAVPQSINRHDLAGRRDYRDYPFVTIDGVDSRDFDDAVFAAARKTVITF